MNWGTRKTPFEVAIVFNPKGFSKLRDISHEDKRSAEVEEFVEHMSILHNLVKQHLEESN